MYVVLLSRLFDCLYGASLQHYSLPYIFNASSSSYAGKHAALQ